MAPVLQAPLSAPSWSALQTRALAAMQVERYVRRLAPVTPPPLASPGSWSAADCGSPLAAAVARAAGATDVAQFCASHARLPDLTQLRHDPATKRALWRSLRSLRSLVTRP